MCEWNTILLGMAPAMADSGRGCQIQEYKSILSYTPEDEGKHRREGVGKAAKPGMETWAVGV